MKYYLLIVTIIFSALQINAQSKIVEKIDKDLKSSSKITKLKVKVDNQKDLDYVLDHIVSFENLNKLEILNYTYNCLYIDERLLVTNKLEWLYIKNVRLKDINLSFEKLTNLEILTLNECKLRQVPPSIFKLSSLKHL